MFSEDQPQSRCNSVQITGTISNEALSDREAVMKFTVLLALLLSACAAPQISQFQQSEDRMANEITACKVTTSSRKEYGECWRTATSGHWARMGVPHADLVHVAGAEMVALGERIDGKRITSAEYDLAVAKVKSNMIAEMSQRDNHRTIANAAADGAAAAAAPRFCTSVWGGVQCR
jgi:hypothetical protein